MEFSTQFWIIMWWFFCTKAHIHLCQGAHSRQYTLWCMKREDEVFSILSTHKSCCAQKVVSSTFYAMLREFPVSQRFVEMKQVNHSKSCVANQPVSLYEGYELLILKALTSKPWISLDCRTFTSFQRLNSIVHNGQGHKRKSCCSHQTSQHGRSYSRADTVPWYNPGRLTGSFFFYAWPSYASLVILVILFVLRS